MTNFFQKSWQRIKHEFYYPQSSTNPIVQQYLIKIDTCIKNKMMRELFELVNIIRNDQFLTDKETSALLQEIAWPGWFLVEKQRRCIK